MQEKVTAISFATSLTKQYRLLKILFFNNIPEKLE